MSIFTVKQAILWGEGRLRAKGIASARLDAEILLSFALGKPREFLILNPGQRITNYQLRAYQNLIKKRAQNYPIAYIVGHKEFYDLDFLVTKDVLVPRPETELLVELALDYCRGRACPCPKKATARVAPTKILDLGTGSGCIGLTLAKHLPRARVICADISPKALAVARKNAHQLKLSSVQFVLSDLLAKVKTTPNIIVANLPYLTIDELKEPSISQEPRLALYGGKDGLALYEKLFQQLHAIHGNVGLCQTAKSDIAKNPCLFLEISESQGKKITALARRYFPKAKVEIKKDLAGKHRVAVIKI